ncbi:hypothetical protein Tco_0733832 [Tanacetum coccineum]
MVVAQIPPTCHLVLSASKVRVAAKSESPLRKKEMMEIEESKDSEKIVKGPEDEGPTTEDEYPTTKDKDPAVEDEGLTARVEGPEEEDAIPVGSIRQLRICGLTGSGSAPESGRPGRVSVFRQPTLTTWTDPEDGQGQLGRRFSHRVLALEAWAGQTNAQRAALWHAISDVKGRAPIEVTELQSSPDARAIFLRISFEHIWLGQFHLRCRQGLSSSKAGVAAILISALLNDAKDEGPTAEDEDPAAKDEDPTVEDKGLTAGVEGPDMDDEGYGLDNESRSIDDEVHSVESDGCSLEEEEVVPGGQQQAALVVGTTVSAPLGLSYGALRHCELELEEGDVYCMFEVGHGVWWATRVQDRDQSPVEP